MLDGAWLDEFHPVIATADGALRIFDLHCGKSNSPFDFALQAQLEHFTKPLHSPNILPAKLSGLLEACTCKQANFEQAAQIRMHELAPAPVTIPVPWIRQIQTARNIAERCLTVAQYFTDEQKIKFWNLALQSIYEKQHVILQSPDLEQESAKFHRRKLSSL